MNKIFFVFLVLLPVAAPHAGAIGVSDWVQPGSATLATLRARLQQALLPAAPQALAAEVAHCLGSLNSSGLFTDIDYSDTGTSWWKTAVHLKRALLMGMAYHSPNSSYYQSPAVYNATHLATKAWIQHDFQNPNWWWMQIGVPRILARLLFLLNDTALAGPAAPLLDRGSVAVAAGMTACNRVWVASANVLRSAFDGNLTRLGQAYAVIQSAIAISTPGQDGIQYDNSFHQHGPQLYMGWGYGALFTANVLETEHYVSGTELALSDDQWQLFATLLLDGQQLATRGPNFDYTASGRLMTYNAMQDSWGMNGGHYHYFAALSDSRLAFPTFAPPFTTPLGVVFAPLLTEVNGSRPRASEISEFARRLDGSQPLPPPLVLNKHFFDSDYMVHHRQNYSITVRVFSNRTKNSECINEENLQGQDLADGVIHVAQTGHEYDNVYPVWQWKRIPGTLEMQDNSVLDCDSVEKVQHSAFVGGASDGLVGMMGMDYVKSNGGAELAARRAWMLQDDWMVLMLANITSTSQAFPVTLSLDQRLLSSPVYYFADAETRSLDPNVNVSLHNASWLWHGNTGYLFLGEQPAGLQASNLEQTGSWSAIDGEASTENITLPVFNSFLDFGVLGGKPAAGSIVVIAPATAAENMPAVYKDVRSQLAILENSQQIQAICRQGSLMQAVWWPGAEGQAANGSGYGCWNVTLSVAGFLQLRRNATSPTRFTLSFANPMVENRPLTASLTFSSAVKCGGEGGILHQVVHNFGTTIELPLAAGNFAGQSLIFECQELGQSLSGV